MALTQKRNVRIGLQNQIARLEHSPEKGNEKHIVELKRQLAKAEKDDEPAEKAHKILLRKNLKESEQKKFQALREAGGLTGTHFKCLPFPFQYGEKLALVSQAADAVLAVLPSIPTSPDQPYVGAEETGTIRASLQHSLDQWKPGQATLPALAGANLDRSHTRSFGETHAEELQKITTADPHPVPASPPLGGSFEPGRDSSLDAKPSSAPAPVSVPTQDLGATNIPSATSPENPSEPVPTQDLVSTPVPSTTSAKDSDIKPAVGSNESGPIPSAGESSSGAVPERYESAEEEKKRLEREEREKLLHGQTPGSNTQEGDTPPPYEDI